MEPEQVAMTPEQQEEDVIPAADATEEEQPHEQGVETATIDGDTGEAISAPEHADDSPEADQDDEVPPPLPEDPTEESEFPEPDAQETGAEAEGAPTGDDGDVVEPPEEYANADGDEPPPPEDEENANNGAEDTEAQGEEQEWMPDPPAEEVPGPVDNGHVTANGNLEDDEMYSYMSTSVEVVDNDALRQAVADVRSDAAGLNRKSWVLVGHVDNSPNLVDVVAKDVTDEASIGDFLEKLQDDQVMYALVRLTATVDMSATVKFVYIHWVGEQVPFVKRGRYGVLHGSIQDFFHPFHVMVETGNTDDLTEEELGNKLDEKSMQANKVVEAPTDKRHERGFTQHQLRSGVTKQPKTVGPSGNVVEVTPEVNEAIGTVRNDSSPVAWILAGYQDNNVQKPLVVMAKGSGNIDELKEELKSDHVMYGLLRTSDVYDNITTVKFVYIYWVGEMVKPLTKGKVYANAGYLEKIFSPMHVALSTTNVDEMTEEAIKDKVASSSGSKSFVM